MQAAIKAIAYHLPMQVLTNSELAATFPEWPAAKIEEKTGIAARHITTHEECASELGVKAAEKLFASRVCQPHEIDHLLPCTQSPDYFPPPSAFIPQKRLDIPQTAGALDFNLGCSGYIYGLGLAKGLIETGQAKRVLFLTAETYSKFIAQDDRTVRTIFGDAAAATLIEGRPSAPAQEPVGPFVYGTDGSGADNLIVKTGAMRSPLSEESEAVEGKKNKLHMNGPEIFNFTLQSVPHCLDQLLQAAKMTVEEIDLFVFHQANKYMLEHLRQKIGIADARFFVGMENIGNTVSASIPIALRQAKDSGS